ncbi:hypothetical protein HMPREF1019_01416 [Campylobacter sp. 10_1_50]|nr:hypothetical protein HMPREF1019_01416 [Campylobacter sp. 10_1_50]
MGHFLFILFILLLTFFLISWLWGLYNSAKNMQQSPFSTQNDKDMAKGCAPILLIAIFLIIAIAIMLIS